MFPVWLSFALTVVNFGALVFFAVSWIAKMKECGHLIEENVRLRQAILYYQKVGCERCQVKAGLQRQFAPPPQMEVELDESWMDAVTKRAVEAGPDAVITGSVRVNPHDGTYEIHYDSDGVTEKGRLDDLLPERMDRDHS